MDWVEIDFNKQYTFNRIYVYFFQDNNILPPEEIIVECWDGSSWKNTAIVKNIPEKYIGNALNILAVNETIASKVRLNLVHQKGKKSGIYEVEFLNK